jgi:hypothetical protein
VAFSQFSEPELIDLVTDDYDDDALDDLEDPEVAAVLDALIDEWLNSAD